MLVHSLSPLHSLDDYSKLQLHCFKTIHDSVREKLKASREEMLHKQHAQATPFTIQVGGSVMKRAPDRSCKLSPKFSGPFVVTLRCHPINLKSWTRLTMLLRLSTSIVSRRLIVLLLLTLFLLPHLLIYHLLTLTLLPCTVIGCVRLSALDQFPPPPHSPLLARSEAS